MYCLLCLHQVLAPQYVSSLTDDVLLEENQCSSMSVSSLVTTSSATGMSLNMEMPRKRKGSTDQWALLANRNYRIILLTPLLMGRNNDAFSF